MEAKKKKVSLSIDPEIIKAGKRVAVTLETPLSAIVEKLLRGWLLEIAPEELAESPGTTQG